MLKTRIENAAKGKRLEIEIMGLIGASMWMGEDTVSAADVRKALKDAGSPSEIVVHLNSPGGIAFDGVAIFNALRESARKGAKVTTIVDGLAASAASIVLMAGDERLMGLGAEVMIHRASGLAMGDAPTMLKAASELDKLDGQMAKLYAARAGGVDTDWMARMTEETWFDGDEAVALGVATGLTEEAASLEAVAACAGAEAMLARYRKMPDRVKEALAHNEADASVPVPAVSISLTVGEDGRLYKVWTSDSTSADSADAKPDEEEVEAMDFTDLTIEALEKERPDLATALKEAGATAAAPAAPPEISEDEKKELLATGAKAERERSEAIRAEAKRLRLEAEGERLVTAEVAKDAAIQQLKDKALEAYVAAGPKQDETPGANAEAGTDLAGKRQDEKIDALARQLMAEDKSLDYRAAVLRAAKELAPAA